MPSNRKNGLTESENSPIMQATGILINQAILWR